MSVWTKKDTDVVGQGGGRCRRPCQGRESTDGQVGDGKHRWSGGGGKAQKGQVEEGEHR